jgi:hypothetical protein
MKHPCFPLRSARSLTAILAGLLAGLSAGLLAGAAAHAGAIYHTVERDAASGETQSTTTLSVEDGRLLVEQTQTGQTQPENSMIFKDGDMIVVDHRRKSYTLIDKASLQKMAGSVNQAMKQMEQAMAAMSPEQRAMVEKMMSKSMPGATQAKAAAIEFRDTGRTEKAGEYTCRLWEARSAGELRWQHCVVDFGKVTGSEEMLNIMKKMSTMMEEFTASMDVPWLKQAMNTGWEGLQSIDGYPVLTRSFRNGQPDTETVLQSARTASVPADRFTPPAGYERKELGPN